MKNITTPFALALIASRFLPLSGGHITQTQMTDALIISNDLLRLARQSLDSEAAQYEALIASEKRLQAILKKEAAERRLEEIKQRKKQPKKRKLHAS